MSAEPDIKSRFYVPELRADIGPETGDPADDVVVLNTSEAIALLDVAEAAHAVTIVMRESPRGRFPHADRLRDALERFDFGDA